MTKLSTSSFDVQFFSVGRVSTVPILFHGMGNHNPRARKATLKTSHTEKVVLFFKDVLTKRFKSPFQNSGIKTDGRKSVKRNILFDHRNWNILAFRGRLMSLLELTLCGVSSRPFIPQDKEGFGSDTSHAEKAAFFFKESHACTPINRWKYSKQLTSFMLNAFVQLRMNSI